MFMHELASSINCRPASFCSDSTCAHVDSVPVPKSDCLLAETPHRSCDAHRGWLPETIDRWNAKRPGRGARTDLKRDHSASP